jgi:multidrug efflux pump subunit AcrB
MGYRVTSDQSLDIWHDLRNVFDNGWQAMLCVFLVLLVMLSWREALVAGLAIPVTFLGALAVLSGLGYTMNQMVVIGMVLALGLLVDVFILMMEGMHDGIFVEGLPFGQSALRTVRLYSAPAFVGQLTTILAMAPLLVIGGVAGKFIRIIPITAIVCLALSFGIALLAAVPLSRLLLGRLHGTAKKTAVDRLTERVSGRFRAWCLAVSLRNRATALAFAGGAFALFVLAILAAGFLPTLLYPKEDGRPLGVTVELPPDTPLHRSQDCADALGDLLREKDYLESVVKFAGAKSPMAQNSIAETLQPSADTYFVGFSCTFTPREQREKMAFQYLDTLRAELDRALRPFPGARFALTPKTGGATNEDPVQIEVIGDDMDRLRAISKQVRAELRTVPGATDVRDNLGPVRNDIKAIPKREALDFYDIPMRDLAAQVRFAVTDEEVGTFPIGGTEEDLDIRLSTAWPSRRGTVGGPMTIEEFATLSVARPDGRSVPLFSVVDIWPTAAPLAITRKGGQRAVTIMCKTQGRTANAILADIRPVLDQMKDRWPASYRYHFAGEAEEAAETFGSATKMLAIAFFLVFALLAIQFGSFRQPFIIMFSVPLALIGTLGGFFLGWIPFSFPAMVGVISLIGIVVNDAIVMIDTMNTRRRDGLDVRQAAASGAADRVRPILSTTITTVVGLIPLALSSAMWMPLCAAIIFGLLAATVTSLVTIPCLYTLLANPSPSSNA